MRLVLARPRVGHGGPPTVHAFRQPGERDEWSAVCGTRARADEIEVVESFTGAPCMACALAASTANAAPAVSRDDLEQPPVELTEIEALSGGAAPETKIESVPDDVVFLLSWREQMVHQADIDAPRTPFNGRTLVLALCGVLGWGPLDSVPHADRWERCAECAGLAGMRA